mgnify:CR=1 FL=1
MRLQKRWVLIGQQKLRFNYMNEIIQKVKNLSIGFRSKKGEEILILRNISTNIQKGETVGIVGESGSGKSTLALAMMGYVKQGLYTIDGKCLFNSSSFNVDNSAGVLPPCLSHCLTSGRLAAISWQATTQRRSEAGFNWLSLATFEGDGKSLAVVSGISLILSM